MTSKGHLETKTEQIFVVDEVVCDVCGKSEKHREGCGYQNMHVIEYLGGYGSPWGDGMVMECELCEDCLWGLLKPYARVYDDSEVGE